MAFSPDGVASDSETKDEMFGGPGVCTCAAFEAAAAAAAGDVEAAPVPELHHKDVISHDDVMASIFLGRLLLQVATSSS